MTYTPLYSNVLLKLLPPPSDSLLISDNEADPKLAMVMSCGSGTTTETIEVEEGDKVLFFIRDARKIILDNETYYLIPCRDILLIQE